MKVYKFYLEHHGKWYVASAGLPGYISGVISVNREVNNHGQGKTYLFKVDK